MFHSLIAGANAVQPLLNLLAIAFILAYWMLAVAGWIFVRVRFVQRRRRRAELVAAAQRIRQPEVQGPQPETFSILTGMKDGQPRELARFVCHPDRVQVLVDGDEVTYQAALELIRPHLADTEAGGFEKFKAALDRSICDAVERAAAQAGAPNPCETKPAPRAGPLTRSEALQLLRERLNPGFCEAVSRLYGLTSDALIELVFRADAAEILLVQDLLDDVQLPPAEQLRNLFKRFGPVTAAC